MRWRATQAPLVPYFLQEMTVLRSGALAIGKWAPYPFSTEPATVFPWSIIQNPKQTIHSKPRRHCAVAWFSLVIFEIAYPSRQNWNTDPVRTIRSQRLSQSVGQGSKLTATSVPELFMSESFRCSICATIRPGGSSLKEPKILQTNMQCATWRIDRCFDVVFKWFCKHH